MKKTKFIGLTAALLAMSLTGCDLLGGGGSSSGGNDSSATEYNSSSTEHWLEKSDGTVVGEKEAHTFVDYAGDSRHTPSEATCTTKGKSFQQCSVCKKVITNEDPALGHDWVPADGQEDVNLCEKGGSMKYVCFNCQEEKTETVTATGHDLQSSTDAASGLITVSCKRTGCKYSAYEFSADKAISGQKAPVAGKDDASKNTRLGKTIFDDVWSLSGVAAGSYDVYLKAQASANNDVNGYWNSATAIANGDTATNNGNTAALQADYKYKIKVDDGDYINLGNDTDNYAASGLDDDSPLWTNKALARITVAEGNTTFTIHNMNNGYSIWVFAVRLVKVVA